MKDEKSEKYPFSCNICRKTFSVGIYLIKHVESQHSKGNQPENPLVKIEDREIIDIVDLED